MKCSQLIILTLILLISSQVNSWHQHCTHHNLHHGHYPHHHHDYYNHDHHHHVSHHRHIGDRTVHGHMTNVAPSAENIITPEIGIIIYKI